MPKDCLGAKVTVTSDNDWLVAQEQDVQQLKTMNEPETLNASKFMLKVLAPPVNYNVTRTSHKPMITMHQVSPKLASQYQLHVRKQQPSVGKNGFQLAQYKKRSVYGICAKH